MKEKKERENSWPSSKNFLYPKKIYYDVKFFRKLIFTVILVS